MDETPFEYTFEQVAEYTLEHGQGIIDMIRAGDKARVALIHDNPEIAAFYIGTLWQEMKRLEKRYESCQRQVERLKQRIKNEDSHRE